MLAIRCCDQFGASGTLWQVCSAATEFLTSPGTASSDRGCGSCSLRCPAGQWEMAGCSATTDRRCAGCTVCSAAEHETRGCNRTHDTECATGFVAITVHEDDVGGGHSGDANGATPDRPHSIDLKLILIVGGAVCVVLLLLGIICIRRRARRGGSSDLPKMVTNPAANSIELDSVPRRLSSGAHRFEEVDTASFVASPLEVSVILRPFGPSTWMLIDSRYEVSLLHAWLTHVALLCLHWHIFDDLSAGSTQDPGQPQSPAATAAAAAAAASACHPDDDPARAQDALLQLQDRLAQMEEKHHAEVAQLARTIRRTVHEKGEALRRAVDLESEHQSAAELLASAAQDAEANRRREEHERQLRIEQEEQRRAQRQALEKQCHALEQRIRSDEQEKLRWIALEQRRETQAAQGQGQGHGHGQLTDREHRATASGVSPEDDAGVGTAGEGEEEERKLWRLQRKIFLEREGDVGRLNPTQMFNFGGGKVVEKGRPEPRVIRRWEQSDVIPATTGPGGGGEDRAESEFDTHITTTGERPAHIADEIRRAAEAVRSMGVVCVWH